MHALSEIGGQSSTPLETKVVSGLKPEPEQKIDKEYDLKKKKSKN